mmetsp:Transcript_38838/g.90565  ORF Transcript_38838/g.90565 Transcript_38838/m.90565 type:complete len:227 (-) Transcript_38838:325-1005(-)
MRRLSAWRSSNRSCVSLECTLRSLLTCTRAGRRGRIMKNQITCSGGRRRSWCHLSLSSPPGLGSTYIPTSISPPGLGAGPTGPSAPSEPLSRAVSSTSPLWLLHLRTVLSQIGKARLYPGKSRLFRMGYTEQSQSCRRCRGRICWAAVSFQGRLQSVQRCRKSLEGRVCLCKSQDTTLSAPMALCSWERPCNRSLPGSSRQSSTRFQSWARRAARLYSSLQAGGGL